jgi:hypothetical protein
MTSRRIFLLASGREYQVLRSAALASSMRAMHMSSCISTVRHYQAATSTAEGGFTGRRIPLAVRVSCPEGEGVLAVKAGGGDGRGFSRRRSLKCSVAVAPQGACPHTRAAEGVKKSKRFTPRRKGAKDRKLEHLCLLCDLCVLCALA